MSARRTIDSQFDLFILALTDFQLRDARETMERPFFSLSKKKRMKPIEYETDGVWVRVEPHQNYGMATIWDADILIWAASALIDMKNRGINDIPNELSFQPAELLKSIHRNTGGDQYLRLREALTRLRTSNVRTNIRAPRGKKFAEFSWISEWTDLVDEKTGESRGMSIVLSQWFVQGVLQKGGVLSIDPEYFSITGGRERWLYRVARKHCGGAGEAGFSISLPTLFEKSGAEGPYRRFKFEILQIVKRNDLPGIALEIEGPAKSGEPLLRMTMRKELDAPAARRVPKRRATPKPPAPPQEKSVATLPLFASLDDKTLAKVRKDFPGWDVYALKSEFDSWLAENPAKRPDDYQAAFYGFVRRYQERNGPPGGY